MQEIFKKRFFELVDKTDKCWNWKGTFVRPGSYGRLQVKGVRKQAHRISFEIFYGKIKDGMLVCHRCDNVKCVNPVHLFLATHQENMADCTNKMRQVHGSKHGTSKLTEADVRAMRKMYASGKFTQLEIANRYEIDRPYATRIINRQVWKHA